MEAQRPSPTSPAIEIIRLFTAQVLQTFFFRYLSHFHQLHTFAAQLTPGGGHFPTHAIVRTEGLEPAALPAAVAEIHHPDR